MPLFSAASDAAAAAAPQSADSREMVLRTAENGQHHPTTPNGESAAAQDGFSRDRQVPASSSRPCSAATTSAGRHPTPAADPQSKQALSGRTCAYTFAALATTKAARPANSDDVPSSCAHHLRNSGEVPAHLLRAFLRTGNWYELADRSSVVVRRSTMEVTRAGRRRPFDDKSTRPFLLVTTIE